MRDHRLGKALKIWVYLLAIGIVTSSMATVAFVNSDFNMGRISVTCETHVGQYGNGTMFYLYVDGVKKAEIDPNGYYGYGYYGNDNITFEPVEARAGRTHAVQVRDETGRKSEIENALVTLQQTTSLRLKLGNVSTVQIQACVLDGYDELYNRTCYLYVDDELAASSVWWYSVVFVEYLEVGEYYTIKVVCGVREGHERVLVDDYDEYFTIYI
ncbi:MAG: hypothetical protein V1934_08595 [Methanobacteriota archaeon]